MTTTPDRSDTDTNAFAQPRRELERVRGFYERIAPEYDGWMRSFDRVLLGGARKTLCAHATGRTLEVAVGTGSNLAHYAPDVRLTGIDLSSAMLALARRRAEQLGRAVALTIGDAQSLAFSDASFDTVVFTLCLCTIPDERRALAEAHRVLRPGGRLLVLEHVRSDVRPVVWLQRLLDPPLVRVAGDHLLRDPHDHLTPVGFVFEDVHRFGWGVIKRLVARRGEAGRSVGLEPAHRAAPIGNPRENRGATPRLARRDA